MSENSIKNIHYNLYDSCILCPRECRVNRNADEKGFCGASALACVNISMHHFGEEPIISGTDDSRGSGTIFMEGCNLKCVFCQNSVISNGMTGCGKEYSADELAMLYLKLQDEGCNNINLVTAMHYAPVVVKSLEKARNSGLIIPVIINTGGYDKVDNLKMFDGLVDIYLPDMKFYSSQLSQVLAGAPDYFEVCSKAVDEMYRQVGKIKMGDNNLLRKGVLLRHLMLPGQLFDTKKIIDYLTQKYGNDIFISLMCQYTPNKLALKRFNVGAADDNDNTNQKCAINRSKLKVQLCGELNHSHYEKMCNYLSICGQTNAFTQEFTACGNELLPKFIF